MAFVNEQIDPLTRHTIDRERGVVLKRTSGSGPNHDPMDFELTVENEGTIHFSAMRSVETIFQQGSNVLWILHRIAIPANFSRSTEDIKKLIAEALDGYGFAASRDLVLTLEVNTTHVFITRG